MNIDIDINTVDPKDLSKYTLVDIREEEELINFPSAVKCPHIPMSEFPDNISAFEKDKQYLIFCAMGGRSHRLADYLNTQGYKTLSVNGGVGAVNAYINKNGT